MSKMELGKRVIIQFETADDGRRPWPVGVDPDGTVTSGLGPDDGAKLIGFGPLGENRVTVWPGDAVEDPASVVGLVATFGKGNFFEWAIPIAELRVA